MSRSQNVLSNAFVGSSIVEVAGGSSALGTSPTSMFVDMGGEAVAAYSVGGRRDKIASSIISTLKTNPKLFRLTISALANFNSTPNSLIISETYIEMPAATAF